MLILSYHKVRFFKSLKHINDEIKGFYENILTQKSAIWFNDIYYTGF